MGFQGFDLVRETPRVKDIQVDAEEAPDSPGMREVSW